jgi:hypothetical protein
VPQAPGVTLFIPILETTMAQFDMQSEMLPLAGHAVLPMDGTHKTGTINTAKGGAVTLLATTANPVPYSAVAWALDDSMDGIVWHPVQAGDVLIRAPKPVNGVDVTSTVFHCGYIGKRPLVRAACAAAGGGDGMIIAILGKLWSTPVFPEMDELPYPWPAPAQRV